MKILKIKTQKERQQILRKKRKGDKLSSDSNSAFFFAVVYKHLPGPY